MSFSPGIPGNVAFAGDWNGDGLDSTGVFRPTTDALFLKITDATGYADFLINNGIPGNNSAAGDWNNDGFDSIGIFRNGFFYLLNTNTICFVDFHFLLGLPGDVPIAGDQDGLP